MKTINERYLRISGKLPIPKLNNKEDVVVRVVGDIVKEEYHNNQDGTFDLVYILKPIDIHESQ